MVARRRAEPAVFPVSIDLSGLAGEDRGEGHTRPRWRGLCRRATAPSVGSTASASSGVPSHGVGASSATTFSDERVKCRLTTAVALIVKASPQTADTAGAYGHGVRCAGVQLQPASINNSTTPTPASAFAATTSTSTNDERTAPSSEVRGVCATRREHRYGGAVWRGR